MLPEQPDESVGKDEAAGVGEVEEAQQADGTEATFQWLSLTSLQTKAYCISEVVDRMLLL